MKLPQLGAGMGLVAAIAVALVAAPTVALGEPETAVVPLHLVAIEGGQLKVGIEISLGGGAPQLYTFDTGSSGFYAAYNPSWWPSFTSAGGGTIHQEYGDGVMFESERVRTVVGIATSAGEIEADVEMAMITDAWGGPLGEKSESTWLDDVAAGKPPLFGNFFGDFGSGLREVNGLFAILPQLPGNLSSGFVVSLSCRGRSEARLVLGLTEESRSRITAWVPMLGAGEGPPFPGGRPTYAQKLLAPDFSVGRGRMSYRFSTEAILDTGGPTTSIHETEDLRVPDAFLERPELPTRVRSGVSFRAIAEGAGEDDDFHLQLVTGRVPGIKEIQVVESTEQEFVNLGLIPFLRHDVVFDVERGLVGFAPCHSGGVRPTAVRPRGSEVLPRR
jgi:hypothetical protein